MWSRGRARLLLGTLLACLSVMFLPSTTWAETTTPPDPNPSTSLLATPTETTGPAASDTGTPTPSASSSSASEPSPSETATPSSTSPAPPSATPASCGGSATSPCYVDLSPSWTAFIVLLGCLVVALLGALLFVVIGL